MGTSSARTRDLSTFSDVLKVSADVAVDKRRVLSSRLDFRARATFARPEARTAASSASSSAVSSTSRESAHIGGRCHHVRATSRVRASSRG